MLIHGLSKLTLLDFPEHIACTVFTGACNFKCPFCHNAGLVLHPNEYPPVTEEEFFAFLRKRQGKLEGVCITGGEPTLQKDLREFIIKIRELGYLVKLDTNGYEPDKLKALLDEGLLDMVSMDIKNCPPKYACTAGFYDESAFELSRIERSIAALTGSGVRHEFRTTVVRELHSADDIRAIGQWLPKDSDYFLQGYKESDELLYKMVSNEYNFSVGGETNVNGTYIPRSEVVVSLKSTLSSYSPDEMNCLLEAVKQYLPNARIRGEED